MKKIHSILFVSLFSLLFACNTANTKSAGKPSLTPETKALLNNLKKISSDGFFMFGHQDDPLYGIDWIGEDGRSDVKSVAGDFPAVMGFDIGRIELSNEKSLDNIPFDKIRREIINQYNRGGMSAISWHLDNPLTGGDSWDVSATGVVSSVLPDGENHEKFLSWLQTAAGFLNSLKTDDGTKVPVLFRPWHEHTGSWFWWGKDHCSTDEYKQLWHIMREVFDAAGVDNVLYAYSPDLQGPDAYMERYPGDEYVDLLGLDGYHRDNESGTERYQNALNAHLSLMTQEGKKRNKPIALTETGLESIPIADWWTNVLYPVLDQYPVSYVLVWRNAHDIPNHYYAPYPGQVSADDFVKFYDNPQTLFCRDLSNLYK